MSPQKRFYDKDYIYSITVTTHERFPYFEESIFCDLWIEELKLCKELKNFKLFAFCLLPDHFHLLVQATEKTNISKVMQCFKRNFSRDANKIIKNKSPQQNIAGDIPQCRRHQLKKLHGSIANMDSRLRVLKKQFNKKYPQKQCPAFRWQKSFHDHVIRCDKDLYSHHTYIENNFLKHDIPKNWKYSSLYFSELIDT